LCKNKYSDHAVFNGKCLVFVSSEKKFCLEGKIYPCLKVNSSFPFNGNQMSWSCMNNAMLKVCKWQYVAAPYDQQFVTSANADFIPWERWLLWFWRLYHSPIYLPWISHARKGSSWTLQQGTILEPIGSLRDPSCRKLCLHFIQYSCTYKCIPTCNMEYRFKSQSKSANLDWIKFFHTTVYHLYPLPVLFGKLCIVVNTQRWPLLVQILYFKKCYMINV
jgi:hypothetical protein